MFWQTLAVAGVIAAGGALVIRPQGRPAAVALAVLSAAWGALLGFAGQPIAGAVQAIVGLAAAVVIGLAGMPREERARRRRPLRTDDAFAPVFRAVVVITGIVAAYGLAHTLPLQPQLSSSPGSFAWYWLVVAALILLLLKGDLVCTGYGLVLLSIAGPSFYALVSTVEGPGVSIAGAAATVGLALLLAWLGAASGEGVATAETEKGGS